MGILFSIEGPKGGGKTTVTTYLRDKVGAELIKFDSDHVVSNEDIEYTNTHDVIWERGILSAFIYDFLWNNGLSESLTKDFTTGTFTFKQPMHWKHFDTIMNLIPDHSYFILYSSDSELLVERINKRNAEIGKGANDLEWKTLRASNAFYKAMAQFLQEMYPTKVVAIDITRFPTKESLINYIESGLAE